MAPKTSTRPLDMPLETWVANTHAEIASQIAAAEAKLAARGNAPAAPVAPKPKSAKAEVTEAEPKAKKPPTDWMVFLGRVRDLLKVNEMPIKGVTESTKFCSMLKTKKAYAEWSDEAILEARNSWVSSTPTSDNEVVAVTGAVAALEVKEKKPVKPRAKKTA